MKLLLYSLFTSILFCFVLSCKRDPPLYEINNLNGNKISAFGHGGMGVKFMYPIDCYESIDSCMSFGADGSEMDVQMTRDSELVAYHDHFLNEGTLCDGVVNDRSWPEIWGCHHISPLSYSLNLVSVNNIFSKLEISYDGTYTFDCKLYTNNPNHTSYLNQFANSIINFVNTRGINPEKLFIESQDTTFLRILQTKRNDLKLFIYPKTFEEGLAIAEQMHLFGITISNYIISKEQVTLAHSKGIRVTLWNTKSINENLDAVLKSPDYIQSDDVIYLLKIFGRYKK
jgi:glycerophosphoryl diester phosphodiesterase